MSHKASDYVKHLVKAPDGSRINSTEKAILCQLADDHREESGVAFPSMKSIARRSCTSERNCRRVIASLEARGILRRIPTRRKKGGGQSSNFYVFCELDSPETAMQLVENGLDAVNVPRRLMSGGAGQRAPEGADTMRRGRRTPSAAPPGRGAPPIEPLREQSPEQAPEIRKELNTPISPSLASAVPDVPPQNANGALQTRQLRVAFGEAVNAVHDALTRLTPPAFEKRRNFRNGAAEWQEYRFGDLAFEFCDGDRAYGLVLTVSSPDPAATGRGLEKYKSRWNTALRRAFGQAVQLKLIAGNERAALPAERRETSGTGDLVSIASIAASLLRPESMRTDWPGDRGSKSI